MTYLISAGHGAADPGACAHGQTEAAHGLCSSIPKNQRLHLEVPGAGHYGIFSGHLSNLFSGSMEVRIYSCPHCGKMEFFNADVEHEESFSERMKKNLED